jgi:hypothetical protein
VAVGSRRTRLRPVIGVAHVGFAVRGSLMDGAPLPGSQFRNNYYQGCLFEWREEPNVADPRLLVSE